MTTHKSQQGSDQPSQFAPLGPTLLVAAAAAGLAIRLVLLLIVDHGVQAGDAAGYDRMAWNLAVHGTYSADASAPYHPTYVRAPLLPLLLSLFYRAFGHRLFPYQIFQILVATLACLALALAVARLAAPRVGRWVLWALVLCPYTAVYDGHILSESLATSFLSFAAAAPVLLQRAWPRPHGRWLVAGLCLGAAALSRDIYLALIPFVALLLLGAGLGKGKSRRSAAFALILCGSAAAILPWTGRNYADSGRVVLVSKGLFWYNLWIGTWEKNGDWELPTLLKHLPEESYRNEAERAAVARAVAEDRDDVKEKELRALTLARLRSEPVAVGLRWVKRMPRMWIGTRFDLFTFRPSALARGTLAWKALKAWLFALNTVVLILAGTGIAIAVARRERVLWLAVPILYNFLVYFAFHNVESRFSSPIYPFVLVFAVIGAGAAAEKASRATGLRRHSQSDPAVAEAS